MTFQPRSSVPIPATSILSSLPLTTSATGYFDANGNASAVIGPDRAGQHWHITRLVTTAGAPGDFVRLMVYRNFEAASSALDSTYQGAQATSETDITLLEGERLLFKWTNGTPGQPATIAISGEILY